MQNLQHQTLNFGDFTLDLRRGRLLRGAEELKLRPKSFEVLKYLVENSGRLVGKDELMGAVWPDTAVTDDSLVQCLIEVRRALGDSKQEIIKTVPRRGYILELDVIEREVSGSELVYTEDIEGDHVPFEEEREQEQLNRSPTVAPLKATNQVWLKRHKAARLAIVAVLGAAIISVGYFVIPRYFGRNKDASVPVPSNAGRINSIAVLPFTNTGGNPEMEYLSDGISESLINNLSQVPGLRVIARSSSFRYKGKEVDLQEVANALGVESVITGRVSQRDQNLLINIELVNAREKTQTWGEQYTRPASDLPAVLSEISSDVVEKLRLRLSPAEQQRLGRGHTSNAEAFNYYAKAMYHFHNIRADLGTRSESDLAVDLFKEAIRLDPNYALAHVQLGYTYSRIAVFLENNPALIDQAKKELAIAERIDPQIAEVHAVRSFIAFSQYEGWQVEDAIRELRLAQKLDPNVGHSELGDLYVHIGLEEQAQQELEKALKADPGNDELKTFYINQYLITARPDEYLQLNERFFNRGPDFIYYLEKRMAQDAERLVGQTFQKEPGSTWALAQRALLLALQGKQQEAEAAIPLILKARKNRGYHHVTYNIARIYALGGQSEAAVKWLRATSKEGFPCYPLFARDSFLDRIRSDSAFEQFMTEMKTRWKNYQNEFAD
jgi:TolB-like protein/DNA-binding winged helix-turn-helix (wHTH) protein